MNIDPYEFDDEGPSKTRRKKDMHALQELGEKLTTLPQALLDKCNLPPELLAALDELKRIPERRGARKRHMQFIGKVMRDVDVEPILKVLDEEGQQAELDKRRFRRLEAIREQLLAGDTATLDALITANPGMDIQYVRQLIRQAGKEAAENKPPAASRKLFACLRNLDSVP